MIKQILFLTSCLLLTPLVQAEGTKAQEGLDKLKSNLEASKRNLDQYQTNLKIVDGNIAEMKKAGDALSSEEQKLKTANAGHDADLSKISNASAEYDRLSKEEGKKKAIEEAKLADLEKLKVKLQAQIELRSQNLDMYQKELATLSEQRKAWDAKTAEFQEANRKLKEEKAGIANQTKEQVDKKRGYEGEISRWKKEIDRQQKAIDGLQL